MPTCRGTKQLCQFCLPRILPALLPTLSYKVLFPQYSPLFPLFQADHSPWAVPYPTMPKHIGPGTKPLLDGAAALPVPGS